MFELYDLQFFNSNIQPLGRIYNHPNYPNGTLIRTSDIQFYNKEDKTFTTLNGTKYLVKSFFDGLSETKLNEFNYESKIDIT